MTIPNNDKALVAKETELRETLRNLYVEYNNGARAYYPERGERDSEDHFATLALHAFRPFLERLVVLEAAEPSEDNPTTVPQNEGKLLPSVPPAWKPQRALDRAAQLKAEYQESQEDS